MIIVTISSHTLGCSLDAVRVSSCFVSTVCINTMGRATCWQEHQLSDTASHRTVCAGLGTVLLPVVLRTGHSNSGGKEHQTNSATPREIFNSLQGPTVSHPSIVLGADWIWRACPPAGRPASRSRFEPSYKRVGGWFRSLFVTDSSWVAGCFVDGRCSYRYGLCRQQRQIEMLFMRYC